MGDPGTQYNSMGFSDGICSKTIQNMSKRDIFFPSKNGGTKNIAISSSRTSSPKTRFWEEKAQAWGAFQSHIDF